jgi:hypothetical protein
MAGGPDPADPEGLAPSFFNPRCFTKSLHVTAIDGVQDKNDPSSPAVSPESSRNVHKIYQNLMVTKLLAFPFSRLETHISV